MSIDHYRYIYICVCVVVPWDVLIAGASTADWQFFVYINIVMSMDHYIYTHVVMPWDVLSEGVSTADW